MDNLGDLFQIIKRTTANIPIPKIEIDDMKLLDLFLELRYPTKAPLIRTARCIATVWLLMFVNASSESRTSLEDY